LPSIFRQLGNLLSLSIISGAYTISIFTHILLSKFSTQFSPNKGLELYSLFITNTFRLNLLIASRMDAHPAADRLDDPPADDAPGQDASMPEGWSEPDWPSDDSMWKNMRDPNEPPKALSKKCKKWGIEYPSYGLLSVHEKVMRDYLARSSTHTVDDEALAAELRTAHRAFALEQAEMARNVVILTPQFAELPLRTKYPGEGEPLPHGDPPIPVTGRLPHPLGRTVPRIAGWVDVCPLDDIQFIELHELAKNTPPVECRREMNITF
jgi:hypothetical protein